MSMTEIEKGNGVAGAQRETIFYLFLFILGLHS